MKILVEALDLDYEEVKSYLYREQASVFDNVAIEARKRVSGQQADPKMMGQPFLPKNNQPVNVPEPPAPTAKAASKSNGKGKKGASTEKGNGKRIKARDYLSLQELPGEKAIQTKIDQGKPEKGGKPEEPDVMEESMKLDDTFAKRVAELIVAMEEEKKKDQSRIFDMHTSLGNKHLKHDTVKKSHAEKDKHGDNKLTATCDSDDKEEKEEKEEKGDKDEK